MFDLDNLPDFEPLQAALSLLSGELPPPADHYQHHYQHQRQQQEQEVEEVTPRQRAERVLTGLEKLLAVRTVTTLVYRQ